MSRHRKSRPPEPKALRWYLGLRLLALLIASALAPLALALDLAALKPQGYVSDYAAVIDTQSRQQIELYCARLQKATGAQIAIVTLQSLEGEPIEDVANDLFRRWGIGKQGEDNGLLFLLSIQDRRSRLEIGRGLEPIITDGRSGSVLRAMRPALRQGDYGQALGIAATSLGEIIAQSKGVAVDMGPAAPRYRPAPQPAYDGIPWPLLIGGLFLLLTIIGKGGRGGRHGGGGGGMGGILPALILGQMLGGRSSYGGRGGGGFGGYDSGDSFGGFGGGDSGGGGASSDW